MQKTINVTEEDIKNGIPDSSCSCPVALAVQREFGVADVDVSCIISIMSGYFCGDYDTPDEVINFISVFDDQERRHLAPPFSFVLDTDCRMIDDEYDDEDDYEDDDNYEDDEDWDDDEDDYDDEDDDEDWDDED